MNAFLSLIPWWGKALVVFSLLTFAGVKLERHGANRIQAKWDKAELDRKTAETTEIREGARFGAQAGQNHETDKRALEAALRRKNGALNEALEKAAQCGRTAADVVLPGALGVHLNTLSSVRAAGSTAAEPAD